MSIEYEKYDPVIGVSRNPVSIEEFDNEYRINTLSISTITVGIMNSKI